MAPDFARFDVLNHAPNSPRLPPDIAYVRNHQELAQGAAPDKDLPIAPQRATTTASTTVPNCPAAPTRLTLGPDANSSTNQDKQPWRNDPDIPEHLIAPFTAGNHMQVRNRTNGNLHNYIIVGAYWHTLYTSDLAPHAMHPDHKVTYEGEECNANATACPLDS